MEVLVVGAAVVVSDEVVRELKDESLVVMPNDELLESVTFSKTFLMEGLLALLVVGL